MHRHKPLVCPLDVPSPEQDLCEISMQMDQTDIGMYQHRIPRLVSIKGNRFDGWVKAEQRNQPTIIPKDGEKGDKDSGRCMTAFRTTRRKGSVEGISQQFKQFNSKEDLRRAFSNDLQSQKNALILKQSRQFYLSGQGSPTLEEFTRKRHKSNEKANTPRYLIKQVQVQAFNYPILSSELKCEPPKKVVPHIGKIRHLIKTKRWP